MAKKSGSRVYEIDDTIKLRFWDKVNKNSKVYGVRSDMIDQCWEWTGSRDMNGYGQIRINDKKYYSHRLVFEVLNIPFNKNLCSLHKCDNRCCINPSHLFHGTRLDNARDMRSKKRSRGPSGVRNYNAKLDNDAVLEIRQMADNCITHKTIASHFSVSRSTITNIVNRRIWKHI